MKKLFIVILLIFYPNFIFAQAPARKAPQPRLSIASRDFTVTNYGAVGDGQVATDCSITTGSTHLVCTTGKFAASDVGKVIAVYDAGQQGSPTPNPALIIPLAGTITQYVSPSEVVLSAPAQHNVTNSERTVWGTDNTAAIQAAANAAGDAGGGEVFFPYGHYLAKGIVLDCATAGNFSGAGYGFCVRAYNNISLRGSSANGTILENWNPYHAGKALVELGFRSGVSFPGSNPFAPPKRLAKTEISNLTLRQVKNPAPVLQIITSWATEDTAIHDCVFYGKSYEGIVMGGNGASIRWRVYNNVALDIGLGGPTYPNGLAAFNLNGTYLEVFNNKISGSAQCFEIGAQHSIFAGNLCENSGLGFNVNNVAGVWNMTIRENVFRNVGQAGIIANANGTANRISILNNQFIDTPLLSWGYGGNKNTVVIYGEPDTVVHGVSEISGNTFSFSSMAKAGSIFNIFQPPTVPNVGSDTVILSNNTVTFPGVNSNSDIAFLIVGLQGGRKWEPNRAFGKDFSVVSSMWSGFWYRAQTAGTTGALEPAWPQAIGQTVQDGTITWECMGARPQVIVSDNRVIFPPNIPINPWPYGTWPTGIRLDGAMREAAIINNFHVANMDWRLRAGGADNHEEIIPRGAVYSDSRRFSKAYTDTEPEASFWQIGWYVQKKNISDVYGWMVTRAGYAALTYSAAASYSQFGAFVKPTADNGKVYQLVAGTCTATPEPVWPTTLGTTITNGGCTWKTAANAVKFTALR